MHCRCGLRPLPALRLHPRRHEIGYLALIVVPSIIVPQYRPWISVPRELLHFSDVAVGRVERSRDRTMSQSMGAYHSNAGPGPKSAEHCPHALA
jgi:hypothetical protein